MKRPNIRETSGCPDLKDIHMEYLKSPLLFMHVKFLDKYIDYLEDQLINEETPIILPLDPCPNICTGVIISDRCNECGLIP
jgi:hypothetical protein